MGYTIMILATSAIAYLAWRLAQTFIWKQSTIRGMRVRHMLGIDPGAIASFHAFQKWQSNVERGLVAQDGVVIDLVTVRDVYMFGPRIGFLLLDVDATMDGVRLPGAVLLRGASAVVLMWFRVEGHVRVLLVKQPRLATGRCTWEPPAGMIDGNGDIQGRMFLEIREETGVVVRKEDLVHHSDVRPYTSCGLLDEELELFSVEIDPPDLDSPGGVLGNRSEGEVICTVEAVPLEDPRVCMDAKLLLLLSVVEFVAGPKSSDILNQL